MASKKTMNRVNKLVQAMRKERGYGSEAWEYAAETNFDFVEAYNNLYKIALTAGKALPLKTREFIAIALLAFRGQEGAVYEHMKRAIRHGATKQELFEAIATTVIPGGTPTFNAGLQALMKIVQDEKSKF